MSDPDLDAQSLGLALHDRVRDERPDLDRLVDRAATTGRRIRRRRRAGSTVAAVAAVVAVATVGTQLSGGASPTSDTPSYIGSPSAGSSRDASAGVETPAAEASDDHVTTVRLSELLRMVSVLRDELRDEPAGTPRADELRELLAGVRVTGAREQTRAERTAALERLLAEFQRVERDHSTN